MSASRSHTPVQTVVIGSTAAGTATTFSILDVLASVGRDWEILHHAPPRDVVAFEASLGTTTGAPYWDVNGRRITPDLALAEAAAPDLVIVPDMHLDLSAPLPDDLIEAARWIADVHASGTTVASVCSGTLVGPRTVLTAAHCCDEANGGPVDIQVEPMGDFDGKANPDAGYVKINEHSDPCTQMETLFFELGNIKRQAEFDAAAGNLMTATREDYIKGFERVEYANVKDTLEAIDKCKDAWGCQNHTFDFDAFRPARDFDDYYNRFLADEHKEWFGVDWDAVHNP